MDAVRIISCDVAGALKSVGQFHLHVVSQSTVLLTFRESLALWRIKTPTAVNQRQQYIHLNQNFRGWGHSRVCLHLQNSVIEGGREHPFTSGDALYLLYLKENLKN